MGYKYERILLASVRDTFVGGKIYDNFLYYYKIFYYYKILLRNKITNYFRLFFDSIPEVENKKKA